MTWLQTARGRREFFAVIVCASLLIGVPGFLTDLFPFSRAPMFSDTPQCYCEYELFDGSGNKLDNLLFGLHRVYWGNPLGEGVGFMPSPTIDRFGQVPDEQMLQDHVEKHLKERNQSGSFVVIQTVIGPAGQGIGTLERREIRVQVP